MFKLDAVCERRVQPDIDDPAMPRFREDAIDARARQAKALTDLRLRQILHVIEPSNPQVGLITQSAASPSNRKSPYWI